MANDRFRDRDWDHATFGYEGEGFMRDREYGGRDFRPNDYSEFNRGDYATGTDRGFNRSYGSDRDMPREPIRESNRGRGPKNYRRSDDRIREDVCERLERDHDLDATDIEVTVTAGVVTLTGWVDERRAKRHAEDLADSVSGVADVQNQIRLGRPESGADTGESATTGSEGGGGPRRTARK